MGENLIGKEQACQFLRLFFVVIVRTKYVQHVQYDQDESIIPKRTGTERKPPQIQVVIDPWSIQKV